jgi:hypothetical protein
MPTNWSYPTTITQVSEVDTHIPWDASGGFAYLRSPDGQFTRTTQPLVHTPNSFSGDRTMKTSYLNLIGFKFNVQDVVTGIQVAVHSDRKGRIIDDTVQLRSKGNVIGNNKATRSIIALKNYGGQDPWGLDFSNTTTVALLTTSTFGISIRMQSHPSWPHCESPGIDFVAIRLAYQDDTNDSLGIDPDNPEQFGIRAKYPGSNLPHSGKKLGIGPQIEDGDGLFGGAARGTGTGVGLGGPGSFPPNGQNDGNQESPGYGNYDGSTYYVSSVGYQGSAGYIGSGYDFMTGYVSSSFYLINRITVIPNIGYLPARGSFDYQGYYIQFTGQVFYWDPSGQWLVGQY